MWIRWSGALIAMLALAACGSAPTGDASIAPPDQVTSGSAAPIASPSVDAVATPEGETGMSSAPSAQAITDQVKADLAAYLNVPVDQISTVASEERTWPDRGLGCRARRGMFEAQPTPGYLITLQHDAKTYPYHTDKQGNFIRCLDPGKPIDPITR